ncbi:MAG: class I SAM-dependent methyltransferase [Promethearchaeota archaeon]
MKKNKVQSKLDFRFMSFFFRIRDKFHPPKEKIEKAKIKLGDYILDYGCGPGSYSIAAAEIVGPSGKVYAVDIHPLAINKVRKKALKKGLKNIETIKTNCNTGLAENSIDIILCFDVMHAIDEKENILKEFHRILKPKGHLSFDDHHMKENEVHSLFISRGLFKLLEKNEKQYNFKKV